MTILKHQDERLKSFWQEMSLDELQVQLLYIQTYQQGVLIEAYSGRKPLEVYVQMLLTSQTNQETIVEIMVGKALERG